MEPEAVNIGDANCCIVSSLSDKITKIIRKVSKEEYLANISNLEDLARVDNV